MTTIKRGMTVIDIDLTNGQPPVLKMKVIKTRPHVVCMEASGLKIKYDKNELKFLKEI